MNKLFLTLLITMLSFAGWSQEQRLQIQKVYNGKESPALMDAVRTQFHNEGLN